MSPTKPNTEATMASTEATSNLPAPVDTPATQDVTPTDPHHHYTGSFLDRHALRFDWTEPPNSLFEAKVRGLVATRMRLRERQRQEALVTAEQERNAQNGNAPTNLTTVATAATSMQTPASRNSSTQAPAGSVGRPVSSHQQQLQQQKAAGRIPILLVIIHTTNFINFTPVTISTWQRHSPLVKFRQILFDTAHDPLRGINALSYAQTHGLLCLEYLREFGWLHNRHGHDEGEDKGLMLQMSVKFDGEAPEEAVDAENWWWTLNAMHIATPKVKIEGVQASCCWLIARLGCDGGSRKRKNEEEAGGEKKKQRTE